MKFTGLTLVSLLVLVGLYGLSQGQGYGYAPYYGAQKSGGNGGFLALIGLIFIIIVLFGFQNNNQGNVVTMINTSDG